MASELSSDSEYESAENIHHLYPNVVVRQPSELEKNCPDSDESLNESRRASNSWEHQEDQDESSEEEDESSTPLVSDASNDQTQPGSASITAKQGNVSGVHQGNFVAKNFTNALVLNGCLVQGDISSPGLSPQELNHVDRNKWHKFVVKYQSEESWLYPLPWVKSLKLAPEEYFLELELECYSRSGERTTRTVQLESLFDPIIEGGDRVRRVLIRADAGFGKSSLCQKWVWAWSYKNTTVQELPWDTTLPVLYRLRHLKPNDSLENVLFRLVRSHFHKRWLNYCETRRDLRQLGNNLIIILDGYDEVSHEKSKQKVKSFLTLWKRNTSSVFRDASIVVTARPTKDSDFLGLFEKSFYIKLSERNAQLMVHRFFQNNQSKIEEFRLKVGEINSNLSTLSPLIIFVLCWVSQQVSFDASSSSCDIIYRCIYILAKRCNDREGFHLNDDEIRHVLHSFGILLFQLSNVVIDAYLLRMTFQSNYTFLVLTGIFNHSEEERGESFEPIHKAFFDSLSRSAWSLVQNEWNKCSLQANNKHFFSRVLCIGPNPHLKMVLSYNETGLRSTEVTISRSNCHAAGRKFVFRWNEASDRVSVSTENQIDCVSFEFSFFLHSSSYPNEENFIVPVMAEVPGAKCFENYDLVYSSLEPIDIDLELYYEKYDSYLINETVCLPEHNLYPVLLKEKKKKGCRIKDIAFHIKGIGDISAACSVIMKRILDVPPQDVPSGTDPEDYFRKINAVFGGKYVSPESNDDLCSLMYWLCSCLSCFLPGRGDSWNDIESVKVSLNLSSSKVSYAVRTKSGRRYSQNSSGLSEF